MVKKVNRSFEIIKQDESIISPNSRVPYFPLVMKRGKGSIVEDIDGNHYIDFLSSAAVTNTGHAHPKVVKAIKDQVDNFINYTSVYMYNENLVELAQELLKIIPGDAAKKVSFGLSG